jgi:hypothetical protein
VSSFAWWLRGAESYDPNRWGWGTSPVWMAYMLIRLSWIPSRSGWDHTCILSVRIWMVSIIPIVASVQCWIIGAPWHRDGV